MKGAVSRRRRTLLIAAITIAGLLALVPPWNRTLRLTKEPYGEVTFSAGHRPLFLPPQYGSSPGLATTYAVDLTRLTLYWVVLGLLTTAMWVHLRGRESSADTEEKASASASPYEAGSKRWRLGEVILWVILIPVGALAFVFGERVIAWLRTL
jgi:hypothetical protein